MSEVGQAFLNKFGPPIEKVPNGLFFEQKFSQFAWDRMYNEIGAGRFWGSFLFLFGEDLEALQPCLEAWSFLLPDDQPKTIIGKNAYGALILADGAPIISLNTSVFLLDPIQVRCWTNPNLGLVNLIGYWLPNDKIPGYLDRSLYNAWKEATGDVLDLDEILGIKTPVSLGGKLEASNFQLENIISYYQTTAPIYKDLLKK